MSPSFARNSYVVSKRNWGEEDTEFKTELLDSDSEPKELGAKTSQSGKVGKLWERMEKYGAFYGYTWNLEMSSMLGLKNPPKERPFPIKTVLIWVLGTYFRPNTFIFHGFWCPKARMIICKRPEPEYQKF